MLPKEKNSATIQVFTCRTSRLNPRAAIHPRGFFEGIPGASAVRPVLWVSRHPVRPWPAASLCLWAEAQGVQFPGLRGEPPPSYQAVPGSCPRRFQGRLGQLRGAVSARVVYPLASLSRTCPAPGVCGRSRLPMHMRSSASGSPASSSSSATAAAAAASRFRSHFLQLFPSGSAPTDF